MNEIISTTSTLIVPQSRTPITIRPGTMDDLPFMDALQKKQSKQLGFMHRATLEGKIRLGHVLVAEEVASGQLPVASEGNRTSPGNWQLTTGNSPLGYLIGNDQYFKRDDVGIIYQINVAEGKRRGLIGAMLLKAQFDRSAYGCRLYCCWCAQDIEANRFWEACGFVPLAFRAGSEKKQRVHIFWSKRIREGDTTTPWWFPSLTAGGAMMEERLVFPIPPGTHWSDAKPIILPKDTQNAGEDLPCLPEKKSRQAKACPTMKKNEPAAKPKSQPLCGGLAFAAPVSAKAKPPQVRKRKEKIKHDPRYVAAARELRDRWMEEVSAGRLVIESAGKYAVARLIERGNTSLAQLPAPQAA